MLGLVSLAGAGTDMYYRHGIDPAVRTIEEEEKYIDQAVPVVFVLVVSGILLFSIAVLFRFLL